MADSQSDNAPGAVEAPSRTQQQQIIKDMMTCQDAREGTIVYLVPTAWLQDFFRPEEEAVPLTPISTSQILKPDGLFEDKNKFAYEAIAAPAFFNLVQWYGLCRNNVPATTYLIDNEGVLQPEISRPYFEMHRLLPENPQNTAHAGHSPLPSFAVSRLNTCQAIVETAISTLKHRTLANKKESDHKKYRVWVINDPNLKNLSYNISPASFMNLQGKYLIKKEHFNLRIKDTDLNSHHIVIEQKVILRDGSYWPSFYFMKHIPISPEGRTGLQNLGNTCYMNSALQCLVHVPELMQYFLNDAYKKEINTKNPLGMNGKVAMSFARLMHNLFDERPSRQGYVTPRDFKQTIGFFNSMFADYHQQDSQEFLAFLLDGLHEDLNRIIDKPFTEKPELNEKDAENFGEIQKLAEKSWEQHKLRNDSVIVDLFVGLYKSTLVCPICSKISITFDPFNDLTLPLPVENRWSGEILLFLEDGPIKSLKVELPKTSTYNTLKSYVGDKLNLNPEHLITAEIFNHQFYKNFESSDSQSGYLPLSDLISDRDIIVMYEIRHEENELLVPVLNVILTPDGIPSAFAYPFFISLSETERESFGEIRKKIEHRYEQLSSFKYFSKVRSNNRSKKFTLRDFPLIDNDSKNHIDDNQSDTDNNGYDSDISLANPDISADYAFKVKLFDSSRDFKRKRRHFGADRLNNPRSNRFTSASIEDESPIDEKVWIPITHNNFKNLPDLLDKISSRKRAFYTYGKKLDIDTSTEESYVSIPTPATTNDGQKSSDEELIVEIPNENNEENSHLTSLLDSDEDDSEGTPETDINLDLDASPKPHIQLDDSIQNTLKLHLDNQNVDSNPNENNIEPSEEHLREEPLEKALVSKATALVCEWSPESFDIFFSGLEAEGEGGINTWSNPEVIPNPEVEEAERQRSQKKNDVLSLAECLHLFSKPEILSEHDLWYCSNCKEHRQASKQIEIWTTPDILTIHLKRFENQRSFSDKIDAVVDFPIEGLDMSEFMASTISPSDGNIYDLFAVDNHYGGLGGGHYTSYVKNIVDNKWYYFDDSRVTETNPEKSISGAAYLLFYRKRSSKLLGGENLQDLLNQARKQVEEHKALERKRQQKFYEENKEDSSDEEYESEEINEAEIESVSSIHVGRDDEDESSIRRKQRLLKREKISSIDQNTSDVELESTSSTPSDDNSSILSGAVNAPSNTLSVASPRV